MCVCDVPVVGSVPLVRVHVLVLPAEAVVRVQPHRGPGVHRAKQFNQSEIYYDILIYARTYIINSAGVIKHIQNKHILLSLF